MSGSELTRVGWQEIKLARQQGLDRRASPDIVRTWGVIIDDVGGCQESFEQRNAGLSLYFEKIILTLL